MTALVASDGSSCPVDQRQIVEKGIGQVIWLALVGKRQQQRWQRCCGLLVHEALLDAGVVALFGSVGNRCPYRVEVDVGHAGQQG
ncbi:hypothetical protein D3C85_906000 [compost metagenome]